MQLFRWSRTWAVSGLLLCGCRSEKIAFQFMPAQSSAPVVVAASPTQPAPTPALAPEHVPQPTSSVRVNPALGKKPQRVISGQQPRRVASTRRGPLQAHRQQEATARRTPRQVFKRDTFHLVLGGLLVAAGVATGLLLGGWLGLGVGAAIVVLGYYFLVLGMGGRHAWLEIFQEFFNM